MEQLAEHQVITQVLTAGLDAATAKATELGYTLQRGVIIGALGEDVPDEVNAGVAGTDEYDSGIGIAMELIMGARRILRPLGVDIRPGPARRSRE